MKIINSHFFDCRHQTSLPTLINNTATDFCWRHRMRVDADAALISPIYLLPTRLAGSPAASMASKKHICELANSRCKYHSIAMRGIVMLFYLSRYFRYFTNSSRHTFTAKASRRDNFAMPAYFSIFATIIAFDDGQSRHEAAFSAARNGS